MFCWNLMLQSHFGLRRQQSKASRSKETVKLRLEELTERILPSTSAMPIVSEASPQVVAFTSFMASMMNQRDQIIATIEQDLSSVWNVVDQEIAQAISSVQQPWDNLFSINPSSPNPSQSTAGTQASSAPTTTDPKAPNPSTNDPAPPSGNSGST